MEFCILAKSKHWFGNPEGGKGGMLGKKKKKTETIKYILAQVG